MRNDPDVIDLRQLGAAIRRGWRWIVGGAAAGLGLALIAVLVLPQKYEGEASLLLRSSGGQGGGLLGQLGEMGGLPDVLTGSSASGFDTEMQILTSRSVKEVVIDSLRLQVRVVSPDEFAATTLFSAAELSADLAEGNYEFVRQTDGWRVDGPSGTSEVPAGGTYRVRGAALTLAGDNLPKQFEIELLDKEVALRLLTKNLDVSKAGGDVARITYRSGDAEMAASVPNVLMDAYLERRRTTDRGTNQRRYEFLLARADSVDRELSVAQAALRSFQESSGVVDPQLVGATEMERLVQLRSEYEALGTEASTLRQIIELTGAGNVPVRELAAFPTFLRNPAINDLLSQLLNQETERTMLLQRRTARDPEVVALTETIEQLESQLVSLSRAYLGSVERQRSRLGEELQRYRSVLASLPGWTQESFRLERDVRLLAEMQAALQAQLLQSRVAAIGEGGDVRPVDRAPVPLRPVFPKPFFMAGLGTLVGLVFGFGAALASAYAGNEVRTTTDAELATGRPVVAVGPRTSLLLNAGDGDRTLLVVPIGRGASALAAARPVAEAAALQGRSVVIALCEVGAPLPGPVGPLRLPAGEQLPAETLVSSDSESGYHTVRLSSEEPGRTRLAITDLEERFSIVLVAVPGPDHPVSIALLAEDREAVLVARAGAVTRAELRDALAVFTTAGITVPGVVLHNGDVDAGRSA